jgi:alkenylglycerophosphocholine/alkenylglycerophosphoethanolamine hydrolase
VKWVLLVLAALAALTNWWSRFRHDDRVEQWSKPLTTVLVIGLALVSGAPTEQVVVATIALALCLVGDVALMPAIDKFVIGLAAFLLGHLTFVVLFAMYGLENRQLAGIALVLAAVLVAGPGRVIVQGAMHADRALKMPVIAYLVVITGTAVVGWSTAMPWVIAGTAFFVLSDSILGWNQFVGQRPWMGPAVMITYHAAIASLALSLW